MSRKKKEFVDEDVQTFSWLQEMAEETNAGKARLSVETKDGWIWSYEVKKSDFVSEEDEEKCNTD